MKEKSVIFVTGSLSGGGAEKAMSVLASGCAELGSDVTLVVLRGKKAVYPLSEHVKVIQFTDTGKIAILKRIRKLHSALKASDADVVIPFLPIISLYTLLANIGVGKKLIMSERADPYVRLSKLPLKDRIGNFLMRQCGLFGLADWMVFQTPDAQAYYSCKIQEKSSIIPNPLDTDNLPERYIGNRDKRIVAAGRFSEVKNFPLLIGGFARFHKKHPEYTMTIYGEGRLREAYQVQIKELGLEDYVSMPGFSANLPEEMNRAAMFISTSNHEGISNVMIEALGMGIPSIVTDCPVGGARMFVRTDENGILIPMNDENALVKAMCKIAEDQDYAERISEEASAIREQISAEIICKQWLALF